MCDFDSKTEIPVFIDAFTNKERPSVLGIFPQFFIETFFFYQLLVYAALGDEPVFDNQNLAGVAETCQLVGNHDDGFIFEQFL